LAKHKTGKGKNDLISHMMWFSIFETRLPNRRLIKKSLLRGSKKGLGERDVAAYVQKHLKKTPKGKRGRSLSEVVKLKDGAVRVPLK